jgi:hypothetical protein
MNYYTFCSSCSFIATASLTNMRLRQDERVNGSANGIAILNIFKGIVYGLMLNAVQQAVLNTTSLSGRAIIIPTVITASISALTFIARQANYRANDAENLDKNIAQILNIAIRVSSMVTLILLAPNAHQSPGWFTLTTAAVGLDILHSFYG